MLYHKTILQYTKSSTTDVPDGEGEYTAYGAAAGVRARQANAEHGGRPSSAM